MLNDTYLEKLEQLSQKLGYSSISALIEAVAKQELSLNQIVILIKD